MLLSIIPRFVIRLLFRSFEAREDFLLQVKTLRRAVPDRPIAFATHGGGVVEFLALRLFLLEEFGTSLELKMATRIPGAFVESLSSNIRRVAAIFRLAKAPRSRIQLCADELHSGRPILLNFATTERKRAFEAPKGEIELSFLAREVPQLVIIPLAVVWRRKRRLEESQNVNLGARLWRNYVTPFSPWSVLLGDPYQPTELRKLMIMLRQYARSQLRATMPLEVTELPPAQLRKKILISITQEKRVTLGGTYRSTKLIAEGIFQEPSFREFIKIQSLTEGIDEATLFKRAGKIFNEMAARFSYFTVEYAAWFLHKVFTKIFEDITINEDDFERVRELSKEGSLVFIPSHKSYVDFLVLSYLLFRKGLLPPHVAAGINLNVWPVGNMFKGSGAFFIRRSFRGNALYSEIFRRYVTGLVNMRVGLEFFIEGARSRSGKLSPPKFGLLKIITESFLSGEIKEKVRILPISITYDRVTEERAHKRELEGGEKVQESTFGVMKAGKVLFKTFGKVHVRFGEAIKLEEAVEAYMGEGAASENTRKLGIQKIAFEVCHRINSVSPITSFGVVCATVLAKPGAAIPRSQLDRLLTRIEADATRLRIPMTPELSENFKWACQRAISSLINDKILVPYESSDGAHGLKIPEKQSIAALFYKNSFIHAFLIPAICGLAKNDQAKLLELRALLQFEFFFSEKDQYLKQIKTLPEDLFFELYAFMLEDSLDNISLGLMGLRSMSGLWLTDKEWKLRLLKYGRSTVTETPGTRCEAVNTQGFSAFVEMAKNRQWLKAAEAKKSDLFTPCNNQVFNTEIQNIKQVKLNSESWEKMMNRL